MTTSQTAFLSEILSGGDSPVTGQTIPAGQLAYFEERLKGRVYSLVVGEFLRQQRLNPDLTQAAIARRLGKRPEQVNRWLSGPGNWTLETVSALILAISGGEPLLGVAPLRVEARNQTLSERQDSTAGTSAAEPLIADTLRKAARLLPEDNLIGNAMAPHVNFLQSQQGYQLLEDAAPQQRTIANSNEQLRSQIGA